MAARTRLLANLNEQAWAAAPETEPFLCLGTRTAAKRQTRAKPAFDGEDLHAMEPSLVVWARLFTEEEEC